MTPLKLKLDLVAALRMSQASGLQVSAGEHTLLCKVFPTVCDALACQCET